MGSKAPHSFNTSNGNAASATVAKVASCSPFLYLAINIGHNSFDFQRCHRANVYGYMTDLPSVRRSSSIDHKDQTCRRKLQHLDLTSARINRGHPVLRPETGLRSAVAGFKQTKRAADRTCPMLTHDRTPSIISLST
jgi:hypothetical protein